MIHCDKTEDIKEIKQDVKDIKSILQNNLINNAKLETKVSLLEKVATGLGTALLGVITFLIQKKL